MSGIHPLRLFIVPLDLVCYTETDLNNGVVL